MKSILLILLACIFSLNSSAKLKFREKNFADTINIKYRNGVIYVPVTIMGKTYDFLFDTGATTCVIPEYLAEEFFVREVMGLKVRAFDESKSATLKRGVISEMTIGNLHLSGMKGVCMPADNFILGAYHLSGRCRKIKIDLKNKLLILSDRKDMFLDEKGYEMPLKITANSLKTDFRLSYGCKGGALIDTGNNSTFVLGREYYDRSLSGEQGAEFRQQVVWSDFGSTSSGINGMEAPSEKNILNLKHLTIGQMTFKNVPIFTSQRYTGIGCGLLEYGSMIIDTNAKKLLFQPYCGSNTIVMNGRVPQIGYNYSSGKVLVEIINPKSLYYILGVRKGDEVIEFDGTTIHSHEQLASLVDKKDKNAAYIIKFRTPTGRIITVDVPQKVSTP